MSDVGDVVVPLKFLIMGLDRHSANLQVAIDLLKTGDGELLILRVESLPQSNFLPIQPQTEPSPEMSDVKECDILPLQLCKLRNLLHAKLQGMRLHSSTPCSAPSWLSTHKPPFGRPRFRDGLIRHHGRPHHMRPYLDNHSHHRHHFVRAFTRGLLAILIPVMAGITVGLSVSFLGLVIGRAIGCMWIRLGRGGQHRFSSVTMEECDEFDCDSKILLDEPPPLYEAAPAYEEIEKGQI